MGSPVLHSNWSIVLVVTPQNVQQLRETLNEVQARSLSHDISVLATDSASVRHVLSAIDVPVHYKLPPEVESGSYWSNIVSSYEFNGDRNLFLFAGAHVPEHWDARLISAGQRASEAVAVAPLSVRHPILTAFSDPAHEPGLTVDEMDQWVNEYAEGIEFSVPVMPETCLLLQGPYWREASLQYSDDRSLLEHLRLKGKCLVATDQVYIDDNKLHSNCDISFLPESFLGAYKLRHPLASTRHALTELSLRGEKPAIVRHCLPVELHVGHSWGGGLSRWIENYIEADVSHNHLVLRSIGDRSAFGQQIALYPDADMRVPLRTWVLSEPIQSTVIAHFEYQRLLQEIVEDFGVESLTISSLIGHSLDLLRTELPTTYVFHDFFPFCPALYASYGDPCQSCNAQELGQCARENPLNSYFKHQSDQHWLEARSAFVSLISDARITLVAPSRSVVRRYSTLVPALEQRDIPVIEHGLSQDLLDHLSAARGSVTVGNDERLRIVVLGRIAPEKGGILLARMIDEIASFSDVWLLGAGKSGQQFNGKSHVTVVDEYSLQELSQHLVNIAPNMGLLLSIVPETFSYTLSELWAAGIPVLATRLGAFEDRIIEGQNGWLEQCDAQLLCEKLESIDGDREALASMRSRLLKQRIRSATDMVVEYQAIKPTLEHTPAGRYFLPRKTHQNPYRNHLQQAPGSALYIDRQATYRGVLREFLQYSAYKVEQTPRLSGTAKKFLGKVFALWVRALSPRQVKNGNH